MRVLPLSELLLALALRLVGPQALLPKDLSERERSALLQEGARLLLAVSLMAVLLRSAVRRLLPSMGLLDWFGPTSGTALLPDLLPLPAHTAPRLWTVSSLLVATSALVHGVRAAPGRRAYERAAAA